MLSRLNREIRDVRRELLILDADALVRVAGIRGGSKRVLNGFRSGIDDTYMVRCATHSFTKDGGIGTVLDLYTEDGADDGDSASTTDTTSSAE